MDVRDLLVDRDKGIGSDTSLRRALTGFRAELGLGHMTLVDFCEIWNRAILTAQGKSPEADGCLDQDGALVSARAAGWFYLGKHDQRSLVRAAAVYLQSDLYRRGVGGGSEQRPGLPCWATWKNSGLSWRVDYGYNDDEATVWARVLNPDGTVYRYDFNIKHEQQFFDLIP